MSYNIGLLFFCLYISTAYAAPHPATGSSILTSPEHGRFLSRWGFQLGLKSTAWSALVPDATNSPDEASWRALNLAKSSAQAAIKVDQLKTEISFENFAKKSLKEYGPLGMDVLGSKTFQQGGARGLVVDLVQTKKKLQLRQAIFLKKKTVVVITCSDLKGPEFNQTLGSCNQLIKNFSWVDLSSTDPKAF